MSKGTLFIILSTGIILGLIYLFVSRNQNSEQIAAQDLLSNVAMQENDLTLINNMDNVIEKIEQENGLVIEVYQKGEGEKVENGMNVFVHYTGTLEDGTVFDSSLNRGVPIDFQIGTGRVIKGWEEGILGMQIGEKRKLTIPSEMAYGDREIPGPGGVPLIPKNSTLIFDVELVDIQK